MNGKDLVESLSHVDEKYIAEAEEAPIRRGVRWQGLAALTATAACLALVLAGVWRAPSQSQTEESPMVDAALYQGAETGAAARSMEEPGLGQSNDIAPMMVSALAEMTVQVVEQTQDGLVCIVTDPGTSDFQINDRVTILQPQQETAAATLAEPEEDQKSLYRVTFQPDQGEDTITPEQLIPVPEE